MSKDFRGAIMWWGVPFFDRLRWQSYSVVEIQRLCNASFTATSDN